MLFVGGGLRLFGLNAVARTLRVPITFEPLDGATSGRTEVGPLLAASERRRSRLVTVVVRRIYGDGGCLRQALALGWVLRKHDPKVRLGTRPGEAGADIHAWVEVAGATVGRGEGFAPLVRSR